MLEQLQAWISPAAYAEFERWRAAERAHVESAIRIRERLHVEKFDQTFTPPRLVEYQIREHGECVYLQRYDPETGRMRRLIPPEEV